MKKIILAAFLVFGLTAAQAQDTAPYEEVISQRTDGNMKDLGITDQLVYNRVKEVIMNHYFTLNEIYGQRDSLLAVMKENQNSGWTRESVQNQVDARLYRHHFAFLAGLMIDLNEQQIETVKNALTYNVLNVTYTAQLDMIPTLTPAQKAQIYAWLVEARELAIDAGSSKDKHGVFGKYKGRINNYLSKEGYDLVKEREGWYERIKQRDAEMEKHH